MSVAALQVIRASVWGLFPNGKIKAVSTLRAGMLGDGAPCPEPANAGHPDANGAGLVSPCRRARKRCCGTPRSLAPLGSVGLFSQLPPSLSHFFQSHTVPFRLGFLSETVAFLRKL